MHDFIFDINHIAAHHARPVLLSICERLLMRESGTREGWCTTNERAGCEEGF